MDRLAKIEDRLDAVEGMLALRFDEAAKDRGPAALIATRSHAEALRDVLMRLLQKQGRPDLAEWAKEALRRRFEYHASRSLAAIESAYAARLAADIGLTGYGPDDARADSAEGFPTR